MKKNIFWTGGFDSTFRLLQIVNDIEVEEINIFYVSLLIDNKESSKVSRRSLDIELKTMSNILSEIDTTKIKCFTIIGKSETLLLCNLIFSYGFMNYITKEEVIYTDKTKINFFDLYRNNFVNRPISQYTYISQLLEELDIEAEISLEFNPNNSVSFWSLLSSAIQNNRIIKIRPELEAFSRFQLPIINLTKEDMLEIAIKNGWEKILQLTWSCWYPIGETSCGSCFACKRRVL